MKSSEHPHEFVLTTREVQQRFKLGRDTVLKLIRNGTFEAKLVGSGGGRRYLVLTESVVRWLRSDLPPEPEKPIAIEPEPKFAVVDRWADVVALSSIPYLDADERAEIEQARESGELVVQFVSGFPALVPAPRAKQ